MESSICPSFLRKNRRIRKGLFTRSHECRPLQIKRVPVDEVFKWP